MPLPSPANSILGLSLHPYLLEQVPQGSYHQELPSGQGVCLFVCIVDVLMNTRLKRIVEGALYPLLMVAMVTGECISKEGAAILRRGAAGTEEGVVRQLEGLGDGKCFKDWYFYRPLLPNHYYNHNGWLATKNYTKRQTQR